MPGVVWASVVLAVDHMIHAEDRQQWDAGTARRMLSVN